jgi:hypothetical protein
MRRSHLFAGALAALSLAGCQSDRSGGGGGLQSAASAVTSGVPSLINVDLKDVLNDLAVKLNLDKANIPVNAQIPINLAVNVCGVSINILSVSTGGQANCTAKTAPAELAQVVQQQIAAGGSVGGGAQGDSTAGTSTGSTTSGSGIAGTGSAGGTTTTAIGTDAAVQPGTGQTAGQTPQTTTTSQPQANPQ